MMVLLDVLRSVVFGVFALAAFIALGAWAVRTRRVDPSGVAGRTIRRVADPVLLPLERWLLQRGANPQNAGWWMLGAVLVGGIIVISVAEWLIRQLVRFSVAGSRGPFEVFQLVVYYAGQLLAIALVVRVIGSWFGVGRFNRWVRWSYVLTDWIVEPLRRFIPAFGIIDITPLVAWFALQIILSVFISL